MKLFLPFIMLLLSACATGYQEYGSFGQQGYSETQLAEDMFRVSFKGNDVTEMERAQDFTLLRSAELTLNNGYSHFIIVDEAASERVGTIVTPTTTQTYSTATGSARVMGNSVFGNASGYSTSTTYGGQIFNTVSPSVSNTIVLLKEKPEDVFSFDAAFIYESLRAKYNLK